jgi:hypothetical protein
MNDTSPSATRSFEHRGIEIIKREFFVLDCANNLLGHPTFINGATLFFLTASFLNFVITKFMCDEFATDLTILVVFTPTPLDFRPNKKTEPKVSFWFILLKNGNPCIPLNNKPVHPIHCPPLRGRNGQPHG